jgi:hypothetical protein
LVLSVSRRQVEEMVEALKLMNVDPAAGTYCDPVSYGKTVQPFTRALPSAAASAAQHALDSAKSAAAILSHRGRGGKPKLPPGEEAAAGQGSAAAAAEAQVKVLGELHEGWSSLLLAFAVSSASPTHLLDVALGCGGDGGGGGGGGGGVVAAASSQGSEELGQLMRLHRTDWTPSLHRVL